MLTPLAVAGCGWLNQSRGVLLLLVSAFLLLLVLVVAGAMCGPGAGPGTCVAILGFALGLFVGPALDDYVLDQRGTRYEAVIADVETYHRKHGEGRTCSVARSDSGRTLTYEVGDSSGCDNTVKPAQHVTLVVDPEDWLPPRLGTDVNGLSSGHAWTCGGLLAAMEACILYGRLRRRPRFF
ncbi:hypothetical protein GCM10018779_30690 [Streptomyces griseocarneus]|nr:hypothetical protein GCM10018779_30690 [Streptomyces griseocarneus]